MRRSLLLAAGFALCTGAPVARAVSFDAAFESQRERESDLPAQGFSAGLSTGLGDYLFVGVSFSQLQTDPYEDGSLEGREQYRSGTAYFGAGVSPFEDIGVSATLGYAGSEVRGLDDFEDDPVARSQGPSGSVTVSLRPHRWVEVFLGPAYSYVGREPEWQGNVGLSLKLFRGTWLTASYWGGAEQDGWNAGLSFGD